MESFPLRQIVATLLAGPTGHRWQIRDDDQWCQVSPRGYPFPVQGWKLHVSATWLSSPMVLHHSAQVLIAHECAFKFAATVGRVHRLTQKDADRSQAGKFLTIYPRDDDHLRELAPLLDQATAGLPGPAILSDEPYRDGSLVHFRYGAIMGVPVLSNEGYLESRIEDPDGRLVEDERSPWPTPPPWAESPFPQAPPPFQAAPAAPKPVLLADRFKVDRAIRHSARGGVYHAVDQHTGDNVVIKQARAHIASMRDAGDARDDLRREADLLQALGDISARPIQLFHKDSHTFLAMEELDGEPLGAWIYRWWEDPAGAGAAAEDTEGPPPSEALRITRGLADLLDAVHERGYVFRDLAPGNVIFSEHRLRLVDAELVARPGEWLRQSHTPGFVAPELLTGPVVRPAPASEGDHFSLGALLCYLATGTPPVFALDSSDASGVEEPAGAAGDRYHRRIAALLGYAAPRNPTARMLAPAVLGLTADDPTQRWDTARLRAFLDSLDSLDSTETDPPERMAAPPVDAGADGRLSPDLQHELLHDGLAHLVSGLATAPPDRLVASSNEGTRADPCNVGHGSAGLLMVLVRASEQLGEPGLRDAVARVARWTDRRRMAATPLLPGLYFGRAGTAWALYEAARHLDDEPMGQRARELATALPVAWPNPDITHGTAGVGMTHLHLWHRTKDPAFLERVHAAADHLREHAHRHGGQAHWQVAADFDSPMAGAKHLGYAHGVAGIGTFLLAAAHATGRDDCRELAEQAGRTLVDAAVRSAHGAYWPNNVSGPHPSDLRLFWCHGAAGVGTFLVRLWEQTGDQRYRELVHEAARTVRRGRWISGISACHGLAGNGCFLLDAAAACDGPYHEWAQELAVGLHLKVARRHGRMVVMDEHDTSVNMDFNTGLAGVVGFLLRLRHGGASWWIADGSDHAGGVVSEPVASAEPGALTGSETASEGR